MKVDLLPVVESCLIGAVSVLSGIVWQQRRAIEALQTDRLAIGNRLGTIQQHAANTGPLSPHDEQAARLAEANCPEHAISIEP